MNREACKEFCAAPDGYDCKAGPYGYCSMGEAVHGHQRREAPPPGASPADRVPPPPEDPEVRLRWKERYHAFNYGMRPTTLREAPPLESATQPYICPVCRQTGTSGYCDNLACKYEGCRFVGRAKYYTRASKFVENGLREEEPELPRSWQPSEIARDQRMAALQGARTEGSFAAAAGLSRDTNPHPEGTALWISWNAGWKAGA